MAIIVSVREIWGPILRRTYDMSFSKMTKRLSKSLWVSLMFIFTFFYYAVSKPEKLTLKMSKTAQKISEMKIPKFMRKKFFRLYSKYYQVKLEQMVDPIDSFETFSAFFTRKVHPRTFDPSPKSIISPADSKILKISEIYQDSCSIIKGASYSLGQLITGSTKKFTQEEIQNLKKNPKNKLYQVIFYLAPGDYHRFHTPTSMQVEKRTNIGGVLLSVSQKTLIKRKKVYERNGRMVIEGKWSKEDGFEKYMCLVMVGALNVGRIIVQEHMNLQKGSEIGYFNLGSTIVMIFEAEGIKKWHKKEGDKIRYGDSLCEIE